MTALRSTGSVRRRARAAGPPAPRRPRFSRAAQPLPPTSAPPLPPPAAEPLEPRRLLATFVVTTTADEGPGSLRQAILDANLAVGADEIRFAIGGEAGTVHTIRPLSALPGITDAVTIDGATQAGYLTQPRVEIDGSAAGANVDGLAVVAPGTTLRALAINRFSRHGVAFQPTSPRSDPLTVVSCHVGTDAFGEAAMGNGGAGLFVRGVLVVTGGRDAAPSVVSANRLAGIWAAAGFAGRVRVSVSIEGARVGTNAAGTAALGNGGDGVFAEYASEIIIGVPAGPPRPNVISGNGGSGVRVTSESPTVRIHGNFIGTDVTGTRPLPNGQDAAAADRDGVTLKGGQSVTVADNVVSGNAGAGIALTRPPAAPLRAYVTHNFVGTDGTGRAPLGNGGDGVVAGPGVVLDLLSNTLSANRGNGVFATGDRALDARVTLSGNYVGSNSAGDAIGNGGNGVELREVSAAVVGGPNPLYAGNGPIIFPPPPPIEPGTYQNVISANAGHGLAISGRPGSGIRGGINTVVWSNHIGTDRTGLLPLGNAGSGIYLLDAARARIGAPSNAAPRTFQDGRAGNVIVDNGGDGITIVGAGLVSQIFNHTTVHVAGNRVGVGFDSARPTRVVPMPNRGWGVSLTDASHVRIADDGPVPANTIAHNARGGVLVRADAAPAERNRILGNTIYANGGPAIDLAPNMGRTPNDPGDADVGANLLTNHPVIGGMAPRFGVQMVRVDLRALPNHSYRIEVFSSTGPGAGGSGQGQQLLAVRNVSTDATGRGSVTIDLPAPVPPAAWLSATATDFYGNTSEFSPPVPARPRVAYRPGRPPARPAPPAPLAPLAPPASAAALRLAPGRRDAFPPPDLLA